QRTVPARGPDDRAVARDLEPVDDVARRYVDPDRRQPGIELAGALARGRVGLLPLRLAHRAGLPRGLEEQRARRHELAVALAAVGLVHDRGGRRIEPLAVVEGSARLGDLAFGHQLPAA